MRRKALVTAVALLALAGGVRSATDELDTDLMHAIEDSNKSLASNIATQQAKGAGNDAKELTEMFAQVESFYVNKGDAPDAVQLAKKSRELSAQIQQLVGSSDFGAATDAATTLSRTCKTCHNFYKKS